MTAARLNSAELGREAYTAVLGVEHYLQGCGLEKSLLALAKLRASQINGCAFCLDMHSRAARAAGDTEQRLYLLDAWRESPLYSEPERAALARTECLTLVAARGAPDAEYAALTRHFSPREIVDLSTAIGQINMWNRLMVATRAQHPTVQAKAA